MKLALRLFNRQVVDACKPPSHQATIVKLPILVAIRAKPIPGIVVLFVGKANGDAIFGVSPELLD